MTKKEPCLCPLCGSDVAALPPNGREYFSSLQEVRDRYPGLTETRVYALFRNEPGVIKLQIPGQKRPVYIVPWHVEARVIRRSTVPEPLV